MLKVLRSIVCVPGLLISIFLFSGEAFGSEITISEFGLRKLLTGKNKNLFIPTTLVKSLKKNTILKLRLLESSKLIGSATIKSINKINITKPGRNFTSGQLYLWFFYNQKRSIGTVYSVNLANIKTTYKLDVRMSNAISSPFPMVSTVRKKDIPALLGKGAVMLNVSDSVNKPMFKKLAIPNSKSLIYKTTGKYFNATNYSFNPAEIQTLTLRSKFENLYLLKSLLGKVKKGQQPKLIIYCQNKRDISCPRALLYLRWLGFKSIYWYRDGAFDWHSRCLDTPLSVPGVNVINTAELQALRKKRLITVDVSPVYSYKKEHLPAALNIPFPIEYFPNFPYREERYPRKASEIKNKTTYNFTKIASHKEKDIVVYSGSVSPWASYFAAITLRDAGFKKIHLYRGGLDEWKYLGKATTISKKIRIKRERKRKLKRKIERNLKRKIERKK